MRACHTYDHARFRARVKGTIGRRVCNALPTGRSIGGVMTVQSASAVSIPLPHEGVVKTIELLRPILPSDVLAVKLDAGQITALVLYFQQQGFQQELRRRSPRALLPEAAPPGTRARVSGEETFPIPSDIAI